MTILTPIAVSSSPLLRAVQAGGDLSPKALAEASGRKPNNISRDLGALEKAGLIAREPGSPPALTADGVAVLAELDGGGAAPAPAPLPGGMVELRHWQIRPDALNPRKFVEADDEALAELADSIAKDGLLENLVVRRPGDDVVYRGEDWTDEHPLYRLVAGERRWRAVGLLIADGRWPEERTLICKSVDIDDAAHRRIALVENLQRKDLRPMDEARALKGLIDLTGLGTAEVATDIGFTQRYVQQRLQFLDLPEKMQERLNNGEIGIKEARTWLQNRPTLAEWPVERWLLMLEIFDRSARENEGDAYGEIEVGPTAIASEGPHMPEKYHGLWYGPAATFEAGFETGRYHMRLYEYGSGPQLKLRFGQQLETEAGRHDALTALRIEAKIPGGYALPVGKYAFDFLNGPWEIDPAITAQIEEAKLERARQDEARQAKATALARRQGEAFNVAQSITVQHRKRDLLPLDDRYSTATADIGMVLPVHVSPNGDVIDADGLTQIRTGYMGEAPTNILARNRLIALAINAAAGLHTPEPPEPELEEPATRAEFLRMVAGNLEDDLEISETSATSMAEAGLVAFLAQESISYGDDGFGWDYDGAMTIAELIGKHGLGLDDSPKQIDLEEAIEAQAEDEATPDYLRNLAGPGAEAEAGQ